jgi:regulator of protease activity HflC (stomatin/prohibitin superfamily)
MPYETIDQRFGSIRRGFARSVGLLKEIAEVPSSEGLLIHLEASLLYRLEPAQATAVYQKIGRDYRDVVVSPNVRPVMRTVTAAHTASALYSDARESVAQQMLAGMRKIVQPRGIIIENVLLRDIKRPATLKASIEARQQADQDPQRMNFVLQKEW